MIKKVAIIYQFETAGKPVPPNPESHLLSIMYKMSNLTTHEDDIQVKVNLDTIRRIKEARPWFESRKNHDFYSLYIPNEIHMGSQTPTSVVLAVKKGTFSHKSLDQFVKQFNAVVRPFKSIEALQKIREMYK